MIYVKSVKFSGQLGEKENHDYQAWKLEQVGLKLQIKEELQLIRKLEVFL